MILALRQQSGREIRGKCDLGGLVGSLPARVEERDGTEGALTDAKSIRIGAPAGSERRDDSRAGDDNPAWARHRIGMRKQHQAPFTVRRPYGHPARQVKRGDDAP